MNQITILQHLRKPKAILEIIITTTTSHINILQLRKSTPNTRRRINRHKRIPGPIPVCLITRCSVSVVETLDDFWAKDVIAIRDVETSFLVKSGLVSWRRGVVGVIGCGVVGDPAEDLGADSCGGTCVGVLAAFDELESEVDVLLLFECETAEDEGSAVETGNWLDLVCGGRENNWGLTMLGLVNQRLSVEDR
jgi:hypothetical protein